MVKLEEIEQRLNECQKALAELKESKKEGKKEKWKPELHDKFWFMGIDGVIVSEYYLYDDNDSINWRINNLPIFKTKSECERYWHFMDTVKEKSYEFSKEEWSNPGVLKFEIEYFADDERFLIIDMKKLKVIGGIYFKTREDAQYIIDNFKDELMKYFL